MAIENDGGVHSREQPQVKAVDGKTTSEQYAEFHKLDSPYVGSSKVENVDLRGKVRIIRE